MKQQKSNASRLMHGDANAAIAAQLYIKSRYHKGGCEKMVTVNSREGWGPRKYVLTVGLDNTVEILWLLMN